MDTVRWDTLMSLFNEALSLPIADRNAFITTVHKDYPDLQVTLKELLRSQQEENQTAFFKHFGQEVTLLGPLKPDTRLNSHFAQYFIQERIGEGGMGVVYLAYDNKLQRTVALKFLRERFSLNSSEHARFLREAQAAAGVNHPNICPIYEINDQHDLPFIVMPFLSGQSLKEMMKETSLSIFEALKITGQVCNGLNAAHTNGIIHRDIKPSNLIVTLENSIVITDFGLAKKIDSDDSSSLHSKRGTIAYMSPEQIRGDSLDCRTDLWSLGVLLYEMICGEKPLKYTSDHQLIHQIIYGEATPIEVYRSDLSIRIKSLISKAIHKSRDQRFQSAREFAESIEHILRYENFTTGLVKENQKHASIGLLPFNNFNGDPDDGFLCEGLTEELLNRLIQVQNLQVTSRLSSFALYNKGLTIQEIGQSLQVNTLLYGSIRRFKNKIRVSVQLVDTRSGYHLWSRQFDYKSKDPFKIQENIADKIASSITKMLTRPTHSVYYASAKSSSIMNRY